MSFALDYSWFIPSGELVGFISVLNPLCDLPSHLAPNTVANEVIWISPGNHIPVPIPDVLMPDHVDLNRVKTSHTRRQAVVEPHLIELVRAYHVY